MKQVVQPVAGGPVRVIDVPRPVIGATEVLVQTAASIVSAGTERAVTALAQSSLLAKARARPDLVRQVIKKARTEGVSQAARAVKARLDDDVPLGYSAAGIAVEVGEAVAGVAPGQLVATGGAGSANHAEFQAVPALLCSAVPEGVPPTDAAFATVASVALHGLRLAEVGPGGKVVVIGLGLLGQLAVRLAQASGCDVAGIDLAEGPVERARQAGALGLVEAGDDTTKAIVEWSRGRGADAVLLMAATKSSAVAARATQICRDRASVVVVGDVGLELDRRPFYERELILRFARSYGPGRHDRSYEEWGVDYPAGLVRWSEGRNQEAVLDLLAGGRLEVADLVTHRFPIADAAAAYELVESQSEPFVGIAFDYPNTPAVEQPIILKPPRSNAAPGIGLIGAGAFASGVLIPAFKQAGFERFVAVASASGLSARRMAQRAGFEKAVSGGDAVIDDPEVDVVVIATPHDTHATLATQALRAGKHVFCEKPLGLTMDELDEVEAAWRESGRVLFVGFNRRYSEPVKLVREHFASGSGPLVITYRVNAGTLPASHWYHDRRQGGRLLGEVCHFIDTCGAIVGEAPVDVCAMGSGQGELLLDDELVVSLRYLDGSLATISYGTGGHTSTEKERIDVLGRGKSATIADFRSVILNGQEARMGRQDKGYRAEAGGLREEIARATNGTVPDLVSTRMALLASGLLSVPHDNG
ncbi:MAG TPA: bi-domain-containing oxidoreductase [Chloroflexota bacterium]|nr:bi-domain-containing oxidoreductase [Chloroflexota bacterium]